MFTKNKPPPSQLWLGPRDFVPHNSTSEKVVRTFAAAVVPPLSGPSHDRGAIEERLETLNQEIVSAREELAGIEDWDLYESAPLKHQIILLEDERTQLVGDHNRHVKRQLRETEPCAGRVNAIRDEIDWCQDKISELESILQKCADIEDSESRCLLKAYKQYWNQLMSDSGRLPFVRPEPGITQEPLEFTESRSPADAVNVERLSPEKLGRALPNSGAPGTMPVGPRRNAGKRRITGFWAVAFKAAFWKSSFVFQFRKRD